MKWTYTTVTGPEVAARAERDLARAERDRALAYARSLEERLAQARRALETCYEEPVSGNRWFNKHKVEEALRVAAGEEVAR